jgi:hypothetical protein
MSHVFVSCPLPGESIDRLRLDHAVTVGAEGEGVRGPASVPARPASTRS